MSMSGLFVKLQENILIFKRTFGSGATTKHRFRAEDDAGGKFLGFEGF